jgi:hypothetical protein
VVVLAALSLVLFAPSAFAQAEPGVTLDPGSPTAKEYALPIEQARRDAGGQRERAAVKPGAQAVPSFGEGVGRAPETDVAPAGKQRSGSGDGSGDGAVKRGDRAKPRSSVTAGERAEAQDRIARALTIASVNGGDSSEGSLVLLLGGSVVMVLGVALGYVLRRRRRA